ncbi:alginate export family protein [Flavicella sediminum]|uniref:alginate export family protein n=1 Tax=Flavicella sediminum TaxID=2585141 RepID=UPI0011232533|nr:alginate export family protein [Flavicella sediminum]
MKIKNLLFGILLLASTGMMAQFSLSGEFRPRTEWFGHGQSATAATGTQGYLSTSVRAALKGTYTTESYTLFTSFQEVFKFGDRPQISPAGNGNLRVQEAWADVKLNETLSFKIGRQPLSYDDQRILGGLGWAQQARTHDAGVFKYKNEGYSLDLGFALNTPTSAIYNTAALFSYREMAFARANKKYDNLNISALVLSNTYQNGTEDKSTLLTAGLHADYTADALTFTANAFLQDGYRVGDTPVENAYLASLLAKYKATDKTSFGLGYEIISGKTDDSAAFFPLYGTNHAFNGLMDRFYVGNHANNGGLKDLQLSASTKIAGMAVTLTGHLFSEQEDLDGLGDDLGSELDLVVAKAYKDFKLVGGYSQFFEPSGVSGKDTQNWAWLMLIISPKFL